MATRVPHRAECAEKDDVRLGGLLLRCHARPDAWRERDGVCDGKRDEGGGAVVERVAAQQDARVLALALRDDDDGVGLS